MENNPIPKFECYSDPSTLWPRSTRWLTSFELYADGKGLILDENASAATKQRQRALLLHLAGPDVQDIFSTLSNTGSATEYSEAVTALNTFFVPKVHPAFARQTFHQIVQKQGETVLQFVTRLRKAAKDCNFGVDNDNQIRDAVLDKCSPDYVRRILLEEGTGLTLTHTLQIADQCEKVEVQMAALSVKRGDTETVNRLTERNGHPHRPKKRGKDIETRAWKEKTCYRCGSMGHFELWPVVGKNARFTLLKLSCYGDSNKYGRQPAATIPSVFTGVGKLKTKQESLHIDPTLEPVAQPLRRTPFNLRDKVEVKTNELLNLDIIEPVDGPTPWVNPVVVVPKSGNDIRLCIDMQRANEAIIRGRHPIPTVDELLQNMNGSKVFSKLDLKWGYHQLELTQESREITTFATHKGLYR
ncbi:uncharacterized protein [Ptychodera flava]|uniref:uncharacterized protein n=1 Tax=Ptychodera flava TaxID=63121 RepID=UPI00396A2435